MPGFTLAVGGQTFDLTQLNDIAIKDLSPIVNNLAFAIKDGALGKLLDTPLSQISAPHNTATISYGSGDQTWQPSGGPVTFTLNANASGTVSVINTGSPFGKDPSGNDIVYSDGFVNPKPIDEFNVPAGYAFIATQLNLGISGSIDANAKFDSLGVKADATGKATFAVTHFKAFPIDTKLGDALRQALAQFVLPLHANTAASLYHNDLLAYSFDGTLQVGFGLDYGISASVAGYSTSVALPVAEIRKFISVPVSLKPAYQIGANFAVQFPWSRLFQCIVKRTNHSTENTAKLHIFQQSQSGLNATAAAGVLTMSENASAQVNVDTASLSAAIQHKLLGDKTPPASFSSVLSAASGEVQKYVDDVNGYVQKLLTASPGGQSEIALTINSLNQRTSCFSYVFSVNDANFEPAWSTAMEGNFVGAFRFPTAVQLQPGSGFDHFHQTKASIQLELFGYTMGTSVSAYYSDVSIAYAGGGRFQISSKDGRSFSTSTLCASSSTDLYFAATADSADMLEATNVVVTFHAVLTANKNPGTVRGYADLLMALPFSTGSLPAKEIIAKEIMQAPLNGQNAGPVVLHFVFETSAYKRIAQTADQANWQAYTTASDALTNLAAPANRLGLKAGSNHRDYRYWAYYNQTLMKGGTPPPNRRLTNVPGQLTSEVCDTVMGSAGSLALYGPMLVQYELGAQEFMNLCDDLRPVVADQSSGPVSWATISQDIKNAGADLDPWFGAVTILALVQLCANTCEVQPTWGTSTATINISIA